VGMSSILSIKIITDATKGKKGLDEAATGVEKFQNKVGKLAVPAAAVVAGIAAIGKSAIDAASDAEQAMGGVDSVFGKSADKIKAWSDQSAKSVGLSKTEYGNLATLIGAQLTNLGVPLDQAAGATNDLISLGADLAATFGGTTADAVSALSSALKGEADPAERYGLSLNQATINAALAAKGADKLTGAAKSQAKAATILELATKQAGGSIGQFARESDSASGAAQIAKAQFADVTAALGAQLLPIVTKVTEALGGLATWISENQRLVSILIGVVGGLAVAILAVNTALKLVKAVSGVFSLMTSPIGLVVLAIAAIVVGIVLLWNKCAWFRDAVKAVWNAISTAATVAWKAVSTVVLAVINAIVTAVKAAASAITTAWNAIRTAAVTVWNAVRDAVSAVINWIVTAWRTFVGTLGTIWNTIKAPIQAVVDWIVALWTTFIGTVTGIWDGLTAVATVAWNAIKAPIQAVVDWITGLWEGLVGAVGSVWGRIASAVSAAIEPIKSAIEAIKTVWDNTVGAIQNAIGTVKGWIDSVKNGIGGIVDKITPWSVATAPPVTPALRRGPTAGTTAASTVTSAGGNVYHFTINGAVDADGTARTIQRVMTGRARRVGPVQLGGVLA
jgi:phage-related protein